MSYMVKEDVLDQRVSVWVSLDQLHDIKISGLGVSEYIRDAIDIKRGMENHEFIEQRKKELEKEFDRLEKQQALIEKQRTDFKKIPEKEMSWLVECKKLLDQKPDFTDGRLKIYINNFPKPYRITKQLFFKLMDEAEIQTQERDTFEEIEH